MFGVTLAGTFSNRLFSPVLQNQPVTTPMYQSATLVGKPKPVVQEALSVSQLKPDLNAFPDSDDETN